VYPFHYVLRLLAIGRCEPWLRRRRNLVLVRGSFNMDMGFPSFRGLDRAFTVVITPLTFETVFGVAHCALDVAVIGNQI